MKHPPVVRAADLFAGAGGASTGLRLACQQIGVGLDLIAVNHWPTAIETHSANHPDARHSCAPVETLDPRVAVPGGRLDILIAAPECIHFSRARGGRPMSDQNRASAWHILRWLELLRVDAVLIENVPEFVTWGPLGTNGRPLKSRKGDTFRAFLAALESLNYRVEYRVLNAADYGEATTRRRLFIQARRGRARIAWPSPTHARKGYRSARGAVARWRPAREVIDWSLQGESIFRRKKPLAPATMRRILEGLRRFGGPRLQPFLVVLRQHMDARSLEDPLPALTAGGEHLGLAEPFVLHLTHGARERSIDNPLPTITAANRGEIGLVEPFIIANNTNNRPHSLDQPLGTVTGGNRFYVCEPFVLGQQSGATARPVSEPVPMIATDGAIALIEPYLQPYYRNGGQLSRPVSEPAPTITSHDRLALVEPVVIDGHALDIRFRMLRPHELAAAMGFPADYHFAGTKGDQVRQIGNAISVRTMAALCREALAVKAQRDVMEATG